MATFKELLGTDNKKEQEARIVDLLMKEAAPDIALLIQYKQLKDEVEIQLLGADAPFASLHRLLELASKAVREQELVAAIKATEEKEE